MTDVAFPELVAHLLEHSVRRGEFTLKSGKQSTWFIDAKQTTCRPDGMLLVADAALRVLPDDVTAIGGLTMGADSVAFGIAAVAATRGRPLRSFSVRKEEKDHGAGAESPAPSSRATASSSPRTPSPAASRCWRRPRSSGQRGPSPSCSSPSSTGAERLPRWPPSTASRCRHWSRHPTLASSTRAELVPAPGAPHGLPPPPAPLDTRQSRLAIALVAA